VPYRHTRDRLQSDIRPDPTAVKMPPNAVHGLAVRQILLIPAPFTALLCDIYKCSCSLLHFFGLFSYRRCSIALKCAEEVLWRHTIDVGHPLRVVCRSRHVASALLAVPFEHDTCDHQKKCESKGNSESDEHDESESEALFCLLG
jgi:hypothetical protein